MSGTGSLGHTVPPGPGGSPSPAAGLDRPRRSRLGRSGRRSGRGELIWRRLRRTPGAPLGILMLGAALGFCLVGDWLSRWSTTDQDIENLGTPPGIGGHLLGTDAGGFDLYAQLVEGTGRSLLIAAAVGLCTPLLGAVYGATIAYWGGRRERVAVWLLDVLILMPAFLVAALVVGATGGSAGVMAALLILLGWMPIARVVRAMTASLRERDFIRAARYQGVSGAAIVWRHILPNLGSFLVLCVVLGMSSAIITETALSYLGLGISPPDVSLGQLIGRASDQVGAYPWLLWGPTVCLVWITLSLALVGDGLRDALDPGSAASGAA